MSINWDQEEAENFVKNHRPAPTPKKPSVTNLGNRAQLKPKPSRLRQPELKQTEEYTKKLPPAPVKKPQDTSKNPEDDHYVKLLPTPARNKPPLPKGKHDNNNNSPLHASAPNKKKPVQTPFDIFGPAPSRNNAQNQPLSKTTNEEYEFRNFGQTRSNQNENLKKSKQYNPFDSDDEDDWHTAHSNFSLEPESQPSYSVKFPLPNIPSNSSQHTSNSKTETSPNSKTNQNQKLVSTSEFPERGRSKVVASPLTTSAPATTKINSPNNNLKTENSKNLFKSTDLNISYSEIPIRQGKCCRNECGVIVIFLPVPYTESTTVRCYVCNSLNLFTQSNSSIVTKERANEMEVEGVSAKVGKALNKKNFESAFGKFKDKVQTATKNAQTKAIETKSKIQSSDAWGKTKLKAQGAANSTKANFQKIAEKSKTFANDFQERVNQERKQEEESFQKAPPPPEPPSETRVFGVPLIEAANKSGNVRPGCPDVVSKCINFLNEKATKEEGIFRLSGSVTEVLKLKTAFDFGEDVDIFKIGDENVVASLLKMWFRQLPENIFTPSIRSEISHLKSEDEDVISKLQNYMSMIPTENFTVLKMLIGLLSEIVKNASINKMSATNISIVFSPTLDINPLICTILVSHYEEIFATPSEDLIEF